jgi:hypothetical protein
MPHPDQTYITLRYFKALDLLIKQGAYKSNYAFCKEYGFNRGAMHNVYNDPYKRRMEVTWIAPLVEHHNFNANWLFTGKGDMFFKTS